MSHQKTIKYRSYYQSKCLKFRPKVFTQACSRPRHMVHCPHWWHADSDQTRSCD